MTAEIGVMNKHGIALAADSAVTIGNGRGYYNTANKLFALSKTEPVAIMVYSNADLMGYPIEILIKEFRKNLDDYKYPKLHEYWDKFLEFIKNLFKEKDSTQYFVQMLNGFLESVDEFIQEEVNKTLNDNDWSKYSKTERQEVIYDRVKYVLDYLYNIYDKYDDDIVFSEKYDTIKEQLESIIKEQIKSIIGILGDDYESLLVEICLMLLTKKHEDGSRAGIVITGYGENELYPSLICGEFLGIFFGELKYNITNTISISDDMEAAILPFAQDDVVNTFLNGFDGNMLEEILESINNTRIKIQKRTGCDCIEGCIEELRNEVIETVKDKSSDLHWGPILQTVSVAPKEELAQMAETLVSLTSFRRKLTMDSYTQTVGGPVDVALITKGDGLIWMKRKHYFDKELNYRFFKNY